jgi:hypothetical protein
METYEKRILGRQKDWGDEPELVAAASIFQTSIQILEYVEDASALTSTIIECPGTIPQEEPGSRILRVGRNHYHAGSLTMPIQPAILDLATKLKLCSFFHTVFNKVAVAMHNILPDTFGDTTMSGEKNSTIRRGHVSMYI